MCLVFCTADDNVANDNYGTLPEEVARGVVNYSRIR